MINMAYHDSKQGPWKYCLIGVAFSFCAVSGAVEHDRAIFDDVVDGTRHFDEPAFYALLERVESTESDPTTSRPARVSRQMLIDESPDRRGAPVLIRAVFVTSAPIRLLNRARFNRPVYGSILSNRADGEPLQALTLESPAGFHTGDRVEVAGYYLKFRRDEPAVPPRNGPAKDVLVPIVVARKLTRIRSTGPGTADTDWSRRIIMVVVALAVIYYLVRRWSNRPADRPIDRRGRPRERPRPERRDPPVDLDAMSRSPEPPLDRDESTE